MKTKAETKNHFFRVSLVCMFILALFISIVPTAYQQKTKEEKKPVNKPLQTSSQMFVLQVGIADYLYEKKLNGPKNDVIDTRLVLMERFAVPEKNIITILDSSATKKNIIETFQKHLIENAKRNRGATILFQYSGHGSQTPDTDGDEEDKLDETLVTYDSQNAEGKNFDITDDEIYELVKQLRQYTSNITIIFDACHSGSGTRDGVGVRKIDARNTQPVSSLPKSRGNKDEDGENIDFLPRDNDDYVVISAAKANQIANETYLNELRPGETVAPYYGVMTLYLLEELRKATPETSYRSMMQEVSRKVTAKMPAQNPVIEGDVYRKIFGGRASREDYFIAIKDVKGKTVTIKAGESLGIKPNAIVAIYDKKQNKLDSTTGRLAKARVMKTGAFESVVEITTPNVKTVPIDSKVVIVANDFSSNRLKVLVAPEDEESFSANEKNMLAKLRSRLNPPGIDTKKEVELVRKDISGKFSIWDLALLKDEFGKVFPDRSQFSQTTRTLPTQSEPIYYFVGNDYVPLYGFFVKADDFNAIDDLEKAIVHIAKIQIVRAIANERTELKDKVIVRPLRIDGKKNSKGILITIDKQEAAVLDESINGYKFDQDENYFVEIENTSSVDLYIYVLNFIPNGSIKLWFPRDIDGEKDGYLLKAGEKKVLFGIEKGIPKYFNTTGPTGREVYKVIATRAQKPRSTFEPLQSKALGRIPDSVENFDDWVTAEAVMYISEKRKQ